MEDQWAKLSPEEKRLQRHEWMLNPDVPFVNPEAERAYKTRTQRLLDVYMGREPDRVPVSLPFGSLPAYRAGFDYRTVMFDSDKMFDAWDKFNAEFESDEWAVPAMVLPGAVYELLDYKLYSWPGRGLPDNATGFQYNEGEYMMADEYDAFIKDPTAFLTRVYLPRVIGAFRNFSMFPFPITLNELPSNGLMPLIAPPVQSTLQTIMAIGQEMGKLIARMMPFIAKGISRGFPRSFMGGLAKAPFDTLGDTLRGTKGIMMDMYRQPAKIHAAMDKIADLQIEASIAAANASRSLMIVFPLHKGADGWMSEKQFDELYWPSLKRVVDALINEGILVNLFAEGSFDTRIERVNQFPKGTVHWMFDRTDMAKAKSSLGKDCSISGNVPASLLVAGTTREVKDYCKNLIDTCAPGGGYLLQSGTAGVDEAKLENLRAMWEAAVEYGVYKK
jgi:uroporphyrinogen-III decarboxylase